LIFLTLCAAFPLIPQITAGTYVIPIASELDRGWYNSAGDAAPTNTTFGVGGNYTVGMADSEARNFFIFEIPQITETIVRAELILYVTSPEDGGYASPDPEETLVFYSLDQFPVDVLRRRDTNEASVAIFEDLGNGVPYSDPLSVTATNQNADLIIPLNSYFLSVLTNHLGQPLALGGRLTSIRNDPLVMEFLFGYSHHVPFERTYLLLYTPAIARLQIAFNDDKTLTLSFPAEYADYTLESTEALAGGGWTPVLLPREHVEDTIYLQLEEQSAAQQYFRLRSPE
jgi:hypothetical protein